jgi:actin-related protein 9
MKSDYFSNYKGSTTELAPFLGGSTAAKVSPPPLSSVQRADQQVVFSDQAGKHSITKVDYNAKGPAVVYSTFDNVDQ